MAERQAKAECAGVDIICQGRSGARRKVCRASHSSVNLAQSALVRPSQECARHRTWTTPFGSVWHCLSRSIGKNVHISSRRIRKQSTRVTQAEHASCNSKQAPHPEKLEESVYTCLASEWQGRFSSIRIRLHRKANENALFVFQSLRSLMLQNAMFYNTFWPSGFKMLCFTIILLHAKCIKPQNHRFYNNFSARGPLKLQNALFYNIFAANPSRQASNCFVLQYFRFGKVGPYH